MEQATGRAQIGWICGMRQKEEKVTLQGRVKTK
jgi:hypothetical protein